MRAKYSVAFENFGDPSPYASGPRLTFTTQGLWRRLKFIESRRRDDDAGPEVDLVCPFVCLCACMCVVRTRERCQQVSFSPYLPLKKRGVHCLCLKVHFDRPKTG